MENDVCGYRPSDRGRSAPRTKQTVKEGWAARRRALLGKKEK